MASSTTSTTGPVLFAVPILSSPSPNGKVTGTIVCTCPSPQVYLLTFAAPPDNRLVTAFCQSLLLALDILEFGGHAPGVVVTTSAIAKFYSNGLDLAHASETEGFFEDSLYKVFRRFLTYPMPTVALVNGHAFAGGLMLAMYHDYRIFNPSRGFLCLNELDFGVPLKPAMSSIFRQKVSSPLIYRSLVLEAKRFGGKEALEGGIVDGLGGVEEVLSFIRDRKLIEKGKSGVYGLMKWEMYRETVGLLEGHRNEEQRAKDYVKVDDRKKEEGRNRVKEWERNTKSKL